MRLTRAVTVLCFISSFITVSLIAKGSMGADRLSLADARQQVLDLGKTWAEAENKHDEATLRRILDDKFVVSFGTNSRTTRRHSFDTKSPVRSILRSLKP